MSEFIDLQFRERLHNDPPRSDDHRDPYERDKARIIHSAAFRRLQGKTQVMGVGEGDFHRTRLTHSIEAGQIGEGLLTALRYHHSGDTNILTWLPTNALMIAACYAHDLGHPPYGHTGERALQSRMFGRGGFESNAQTLRILTKLETFRHHQGINPTRRMMLAVLKYPAPYSSFAPDNFKEKPPKCYYDLENTVVAWAQIPFHCDERQKLAECDIQSKPKYRTLDASIMEYADDIAYAVHDIEDIVARELVSPEELLDHTPGLFVNNGAVGNGENRVTRDEFIKQLFEEHSVHRKQLIGRLVNLLVVGARMEMVDGFSHPLLRYRLRLPDEEQLFLENLKKLTYKLVIQRAAVKQLERRGHRVVEMLYDELASDPEKLIPSSAWNNLDDKDTEARRVCDYVAGMTDAFAEKIYHRLFTPGVGSSRDELQ